MPTTPTDPVKDSSPWPAALVATALIVLVGALSIAAILKGIPQFDDVWKALGTITGVIVGAAGTYFFAVTPQKGATNNTLFELRRLLEKTQAELDEIKAKDSTAQDAATALFYGIPDSQRENLWTDPAVRRWKPR